MAKLSNLHTRDKGKPDDVPIILMHGLAASHNDWNDLQPLLREKGYSVFTPDLPGHNNNLISNDENFNLEFLYSYIYDYIENIRRDKQVILIGHSLGGYLAIKYTLDCQKNVLGLLLCNPLISLDQLPWLPRMFYRNKRNINFNLLRYLPDWLIRFAVNLSSFSIRNGYNLPDSVRHLTAQDYIASQPGIYNYLYSLQDMMPKLNSIKQPTLLVFGKNDRTLNPKWHNLISNSISGCKESIIMDTGHVPHQALSQLFNEITIQFIKNIIYNL